jgi:hypothetical protein
MNRSMIHSNQVESIHDPFKSGQTNVELILNKLDHKNNKIIMTDPT